MWEVYVSVLCLKMLSSRKMGASGILSSIFCSKTSLANMQGFQHQVSLSQLPGFNDKSSHSLSWWGSLPLSIKWNYQMFFFFCQKCSFCPGIRTQISSKRKELSNTISQFPSDLMFIQVGGLHPTNPCWPLRVSVTNCEAGGQPSGWRTTVSSFLLPVCRTATSSPPIYFKEIPK